MFVILFFFYYSNLILAVSNITLQLQSNCENCISGWYLLEMFFTVFLTWISIFKIQQPFSLQPVLLINRYIFIKTRIVKTSDNTKGNTTAGFTFK